MPTTRVDEKPARRKPGPVSRIDLAGGIEWVCEQLRCGEHMLEIAKKAGVSHGTLSEWISSNSDRSARANEARILGSRVWDAKAEELISKAKAPFDLQKAMALAHHYRWRASKIAPRDYGEKVAVGGAEDLPAIKSEGASDEEVARRLAFILAKGIAAKGGSGQSTESGGKPE